MKDVILEIVSNVQVKNDIYIMKLKGDCSSIKGSGQFAEIKLDNYYLRRPLSICDYNENEVTFLYKILGRGTRDLTQYKNGHKFNVLLGLGSTFNLDKAKKPLLIGGGIGMAPLYNLAKKFNEEGIKPKLILGFKNKEEVCFVDEFKKYAEVVITTDDGSLGFKGNPVTLLKEKKIDYDYYYACGPQVMLKYLTKDFKNGEVSLEARMACGIGACMGCSIKTKNGIKRVCKEGPIFDAREVLL